MLRILFIKLTLLLFCILPACTNNIDNKKIYTKSLSCDNSFVMTDYERVLLFDLDPDSNEIIEGAKLKFGSVSQANFLCPNKELAVGYAYRGEQKTNAGIDFISENRLTAINLSSDGFNHMLPLGTKLFVYTSLLKRGKIRSDLGYMSQREYSDWMKYRKDGAHKLSSNEVSDHIYFDLLAVNMANHEVDKKLRFPGGLMWVEDGDIVVYSSTPMRINTANGYRKKIGSFDHVEDIPHGKSYIHYHLGAFYIVTGARVASKEVTRLAPNSIYILSNTTGQLEKAATLSFDPVHASGIQDELVIFGMDSFARFNLVKRTLFVEKRNFDGLVPAACAGIKNGRVVVLSHVDAKQNTYWGAEIWVYDAKWEKVIAKRKLDEFGIPNITSQSCPFPSGVTYNSL